MRLRERDIETIRRLVAESIPSGMGYELRLFGSMLDESARGGDVDLYLAVEGLDAAGRAALSRRLRPELEEALDRPVDLVVAPASADGSAIARVARERGVRL
jgi:predicted nucleotidyltransferase